MKSRLFHVATAVLAVGVLSTGVFAIPRESQQKAFDHLCKKIQRDRAGVTENDLIQVLNAARELGCPYAAATAVKSYSAMHPDLPPKLQFMVAENALLAGNFRAAVARYKNYLASAVPGRESSDAAAVMLMILTDFLGAENEPYVFLKNHGEKFRKSDNARKYDLWFLNMTQKKGDVIECAKRLVLLFSENMPLEKEKFYYWDYLDWIMNAIRRPSSGSYPLVPLANRLLTMFRKDTAPVRGLKYRFYVANLEFKAGSSGKTKKAIEPLFAAVMTTARAYFDAAPSLATLQDIEYVFSAGYNGAEWQICQKQKRDFFVYAFAKLSADNKVALIRWMPKHASYMAGPEQWTSLCLSYPKSFAQAKQFVYQKSNPDVYKKQTPFLAGVPTTYAAVVNALAAGQDLDSMSRYLLAKESWHLSLNQIYSLIQNQLWPIFSSFPRPDAKKLPADYFSKFLVKFGSESMMKSPIPLVDTAAAAAFIMAEWNYGNKAKLPNILHMLDWVPYTEKQRQAVFDPAYKAFKKWAGKVSAAADARSVANAKIKASGQAEARKKTAEKTKQAAEAKASQAAKAASAPNATQADKAAAAKASAEAKKAAQAWTAADKAAAQAAGAAADAKEGIAKLSNVPVVSAQQITALEEAFKAVLDPKVFDASKAPTPLCKNLALLMVAVQDKNKDEYEKNARQLYTQIKNYDAGKTPYGSAVMRLIMANRLSAFDILDFQLESFSDQLARWNTNAPVQAVTLVHDAIISGRKGWPSGASKTDREKVQKFSDIMEKALLVQIDKGRFWPLLFNWFRQTRRGSGWRNDDSGLVVMGKLIEKRMLVNIPYRLGGTTAAATYMWLVRNEFAKLQGQYPSASYFDDLYVEECTKAKELDFAYWKYGADSKGKIINLATKKIQAYTVLPYSKKEFGPANNLWKWHGQCLRMNAAWRKDHHVDEAERARLIAMLNTAFGTTRFDEFARGDYYFTADASADSPEGRKALFQKLSAYIAHASSAPERLAPPNLAAISKLGELTPPEMNVLLNLFPALAPMYWTKGRSYDCLLPLLNKELLARKRYADLLRVIPFFWKMARDMKSATMFRKMAEYATELQNQHHSDLAAKYSISGLDIAGSTLPDDVGITLRGVRLKALVSIGGAIPVDRTDRRYPIYAAQTAYLSGNLQNAWELYFSFHDQVAGMFKELDPNFCLWLIETNTEMKEFERAEELSRAMMQWLDSMPGGFDREIQARVMIAYANIAFARQEFPKARALFNRIVAAKEFEGTKAKNEAELQIADVDRLTKNYDSAIARLEKLARRMDRHLQTESCYQLALIRYEQEDYEETSRLLDQVFAFEPNHAAGRILQGKMNLKRKQYGKATDLDIGLASDQKLIVPGKPLKIHLDDRNLAVVGKNSQIEVRVWSDSGDEEFMSLLLSSDSKTKFGGQLRTALAPVAKGDHVLQMLGNDKIYYDYSEAFKKANNVTSTKPMTMTVASDAVLMVSSGEIISEKEQQEQAFEQLMDQARIAEQLAADLAASRTNVIVRPGNRMYVRVVDSDQSVTTQKDTVTVKVAAYSGDSIPAVALRETGTHSGIFEGAVPTTSAGALAYASDSNEGRLPFYAISAGTYPPWVALSDNVRPKTFSVDLNDNILLGNMTILADTAGRKLKEFVVQTSFDNVNFKTVGSWPKPYKAWDGTPEFEFVSFVDKVAPRSMQAIQRYIDSDSMGKGVQRAVVPLSQMVSGSDANLTVFKFDKIPVSGNTYVAHFRAAFYLPSRQMRMFKLDHKNTQHVKWFFAIDEKESADKRHMNIIRRQLKKGVHLLDVYIYASRKANPAFKLLRDSDTPPYMVPCSRSMFDPLANPAIGKAIPDRSAVVTADQEKTSFDIKFAPDTRARVIRLVIADFETDAPAIRKISLTSGDGKVLLPAKTDFIAASKNQVLEIVAGDKISITYEDPKVVSRGKEIHECFMSANYHNASICACLRGTRSFHLYRFKRDGRYISYIPLYRFVPGEKFDVFIDDSDCDVSDKRDVVKFAAKTELGKPKEFKALETEEHSGKFIGSVFTVKGTPKRPNDLRVEAGENVILTYHDKENTVPGVPWNRTYTVEQVTYNPPQLRVYQVSSIPLEEAKLAELQDSFKIGKKERFLSKEEYVMPTRTLVASRPVKADPDTLVSIISDGPLLVELTYPTMALSMDSVAELYVQTLSARKEAGLPMTNGFDKDIPGTVKMQSRPGGFETIQPPPGYLSVMVRGDPYESSPLQDGRFSFHVKKAFGSITGDTTAFGRTSSSMVPGRRRPRWDEQATLFIQSSDEIFVGFPFSDSTGATNWVTQRVLLTSDMFIDVMDRFYRRTVDSIYVGENLYLRINDRLKDISEEKDAVSVKVTTTSGFTTNFNLVETFEHTGSFKGVVKPVYFEDKPALADSGSIPVKYGDTITISYQLDRPAESSKPEQQKDTHALMTRIVKVHKGADGAVIPFTKRFKDPEIAVKTQFTAAEAFFELAKKHRSLDQKSLARREIAQGKKLLEEAIKDFPNVEARAQADYLLANLALEFASDAVDEKIKREKYLEAINLFTGVIMTYPESLYAPKAQYKKALTFEKMGDIDLACEEYVKLSYMYPDNELVAETIARLGSYFSAKGKEFEVNVKKAETEEEREKHIERAEAMFRTAAQVFSRLAPRFPTHELAGKTMVLSGQCFMRAGDFSKATSVLEDAIKKFEDEHDLVAEAMYWRAESFMKLRNYPNAYRQFKNLTWDYPASKWAKFARGRLTEPTLNRIAESDAMNPGI